MLVTSRLLRCPPSSGAPKLCAAPATPRRPHVRARAAASPHQGPEDAPTWLNVVLQGLSDLNSRLDGLDANQHTTLQRLDGLDANQHTTLQRLDSIEREQKATRREVQRLSVARGTDLELALQSAIRQHELGEAWQALLCKSLHDVAAHVATGVTPCGVASARPARSSFAFEEVRDRLCVWLAQRDAAGQFLRSLATTLAAVDISAVQDEDLRAVHAAWQQSLKPDGEVGLGTLISGLPGKLTLKRTLSMIKRYVEVGRRTDGEQAQRLMLQGPLGLTLLISAAMEEAEQRWRAAAGSPSGQRAVTKMAQMNQGYERLQLDVKGSVKVSARHAEVRVGEVKASGRGLQAVKQQLLLRLDVLDLAVRIAVGDMDLPVRRQARFYLPAAEVRPEWLCRSDLDDRTELEIIAL